MEAVPLASHFETLVARSGCMQSGARRRGPRSDSMLIPPSGCIHNTALGSPRWRSGQEFQHTVAVYSWLIYKLLERAAYDRRVLQAGRAFYHRHQTRVPTNFFKEAIHPNFSSRLHSPNEHHVACDYFLVEPSLDVRLIFRI